MKNRKAELYAIISIENGMVHLMHSVNPDASCCQDGGDRLQLESYSSVGWNEPKLNPRLAYDFWGLWGDWNGRVAGGIHLNDNFSFAEWDRLLQQEEEVSPGEIKNLPDGRYVVYAEMKATPKDLCDGDCNSCEAPKNKQVALLLNILRLKFGEEVEQIVNQICPNLTCCPCCRIDDFCHCSTLDAGLKHITQMAACQKTCDVARKALEFVEGAACEST